MDGCDSYGYLAEVYDTLTTDVDYAHLAATYHKLLHRGTLSPRLVVDLACGTGTVTRLLQGYGYDMIGTDRSPAMLAQAANGGQGAPILYLNQSIQQLDLYGTVDGAVCALDGMNYLAPEELTQAFSRIALFLNPGGVFAFDVHTPDKLKGLDGQIHVDERQDLLCLWRTTFDEEHAACHYQFDLFFGQDGGNWRREQEGHVQYAHTEQAICAALENAGFVGAQMDTQQEFPDRWFFSARKSVASIQE